MSLFLNRCALFSLYLSACAVYCLKNLKLMVTADWTLETWPLLHIQNDCGPRLALVLARAGVRCMTRVSMT